CPVFRYHNLMEYVFWLFVAASFLVSYSLGRWAKSFWFFLGAPIPGALISIPAFFAYAYVSDIEASGLAVIVLLPVILILTSLFNIGASLIGGIVGVFHAKIKNKRGD
ncbi:MAG: hypothetical protein AAB932_05420, partial [Patescibacteria group bacterium]